MESKRSKAWTIEKAENAVKASFFVRTLSPLREPPKLAYKDIMDAISETGNPIGDTTLSRALKSLVAKEELTKEGQRKDIRYSLKERPRTDIIAVAASADRMAIDRAAQNVGAVADATEGWAFYGVPAGVKQRLRPRLRREAWVFGDRVDRILDGEIARFKSRLLRRGRGRLSERELREAARGLDHAFKTVHDFRLLSWTNAWTESYLERVAPGAMGRITASWEKRTSPNLRSQLRELARLAGAPEDRLEEIVTKALAEEERHSTASRKLFSKLPARERERAAREFADLVMLSASWCAVVR